MKPSIRKLLVAAGLAGLAGLSLAAGTSGAGSTPAKSEKETASSVQPAASPAAKKDVKKHASKSPAKHKDSAAKPAKAASGA